MLDDILNSHRTGRAVVMGILNVTPDSFSDGGEFLAPDDAVARARRMIDDGADVIDIGAESTRPGSERVTAAEQIARLQDVLPAVTGAGVLVSIDTTVAEVAAFALDAGAALVNDVSAGRDDQEMFPLVAARKAPIVLMHMLGAPKTMQNHPQYGDVVQEVGEFLRKRLAVAEAAGIPRGHCMVDPGIGFGKTLEHNLALLAGIDRLAAMGCPVLVGPSRKRFIGEITGEDVPARRVSGTIAACLAARRGGASVFRVHDVADVTAALRVAEAVDGAAAEKKTPPAASAGQPRGTMT